MVVPVLYSTGRRVVCSDVHSAWLALNHEFSVDGASLIGATAAFLGPLVHHQQSIV